MKSTRPEMLIDDNHAEVAPREARPEDVPAMMALSGQSETAAHWSQEAYLALFNSEAQSRVALVVKEREELVGFLVAVSVGTEWEIENVVVRKEWLRRGVGSRLIGLLLERVKGDGGDTVFLDVRESNGAARALYEKWGFVQAGRRKGYYSEPLEDGVVYRKSL